MKRGAHSGDTEDGQGGARASAVAVGVVFLGPAVLTALLAGSFWVVANDNGDGGDPSEVALAASRCTVTSTNDTNGVGTATFSLTYSANHSVDLSDAVVRYSDVRTDTALDLAANTSESTARLVNDSGVHVQRIARAEQLTLVVPVERIHGGPLLSGQRASVELVVGSGTVTTADIRAPNAMSTGQSYVRC